MRGEWSVLQLPWNTERPMSSEFRANFVRYWQGLGGRIGSATPPIAVPEADNLTETRAIKVRPEVVARVHALDLNIVYQRLDSPAEYDVIVGTNVFLYYGPFVSSPWHAPTSQRCFVPADS